MALLVGTADIEFTDGALINQVRHHLDLARKVHSRWARYDALGVDQVVSDPLDVGRWMIDRCGMSNQHGGATAAIRAASCLLSV